VGLARWIAALVLEWGSQETGHWLGHGHASCPGRGRPAPVMVQQSKGTGGCRLNPRPALGELSRR
jgi:hypothetical protein